MKSLFLLTALCLPLGQLEHKGKNLAQYDPVITSVQTAMSYESGPVTITGRHFDMVTGVKIAGQFVPVLSNTGTQIVIRPENMDPGFASLELVRPGPGVQATIEFAPSLLANRHANGIHIYVNPGERGMIWVSWSPRTAVSEVPGVYYPLMLDMSAPRATQIAQANSLTGERVFMDVPLPVIPPSIGLVEYRGCLNLQALCMLGDDLFLCHTNMATVAVTRAGTLRE